MEWVRAILLLWKKKEALLYSRVESELFLLNWKWEKRSEVDVTKEESE